jgi:hypothetical protein
MATVNLSPLFNGQTLFGPTGLPLAGGQIYCYQAGSSTPLSTYTTVNGNIANTNPIILGTDGKLPSELWLQSGYAYKFIVQDANNVLVNSYDNISGIITQSSSAPTSVPSGCILIWSGAVGSIPSGFVLCNGSNGTPDLRNSFVLGAGNNYSVGQTGGSTDAIVVSHTHSITDPGHYHGLTSTGAVGSLTNDTTANSTSSTTAITGTATTGISINSTGTSGANANMPPYYALAYIMKT